MAASGHLPDAIIPLCTAYTSIRAMSTRRTTATVATGSLSVASPMTLSLKTTGVYLFLVKVDFVRETFPGVVGKVGCGTDGENSGDRNDGDLTVIIVGEIAGIRNRD